jgi:hypothetical protein
MRLSFAVLVFELGRRIPLGNIQGNPDRTFSFPILYRRGMPLENDELYVVRNASLPKKVPPEFAGIIVCIGDIPPAWESSTVCLIGVSQELRPDEVYNHIREVFRVFYEWDAKLQEIREREGTLQELLDVSSPVFNNMLVVTDEDSKVLAGSYEGRHYTSGKYVDIINSDMNLKNLARAAHPVTTTIVSVDLGPYMDQGQGVPFVIFVKHIADPSSNITVDLAIRPIGRPIGDSDCWMMEHLASYIQRVLLRRLMIKNPIVASVLDSLLNGNPVEAEKIEHVYHACGFQEGDRLRCVLIAKPHYVTEINRSFLRQRFHAVVPNAAVTSFDNNFVILINDTRSGWTKTRLREWMSSWLGDRNDPIGISNRFDNLICLSEYFLEALAARGFAGRDPENIMMFSACRMDYVLARCTGELQQKRLYPAGLRRLLKLNHSSSVDYIATLRVWLDEGMNDNQAAKKLHISRNAFLYRKDRILEVLKLDIQDPEMRFYLSLCLRLLER